MIKEDLYDLEGLIDGDSGSFENLFRRYYKPLISYALKYVPSIDIAEDIVQDTFSYIWVNRQKIDISKSFKSYIFASVHNYCVDYLRKLQTQKRHRNYATIRLIEAKQNGYDSSFLLNAQQLKDRIESSVESLPPQCKSVFKLSREIGLKNREIAEELSISIKAVEKHITKALNTLKHDLRDFLIFLIILSILK